jgi:hypothetical protein
MQRTLQKAILSCYCSPQNIVDFVRQIGALPFVCSVPIASSDLGFSRPNIRELVYVQTSSVIA